MYRKYQTISKLQASKVWVLHFQVLNAATSYEIVWLLAKLIIVNNTEIMDTPCLPNGMCEDMCHVVNHGFNVADLLTLLPTINLEPDRGSI